MTPRERVLCALAHEEPDLVPVTLAYETPEEIARRYGKLVDSVHMRQDVFSVRLKSPPPQPSIRERYHENLPEDAAIDAWGIARWASSTGDAHTVVGPLRSVETIEELEAFPFPDVGNDAYARDLPGQVAALHDEGYAVQGAMSQTVFELAWGMTGMEKLLIAFHDDLEFVDCLLDKITERKVEMAIQYVNAGADILRLGDDVGAQNGMMMNPALWRRTLKPRLARIIEAARQARPGVPVFYHSDGDVRSIIADLIEIGVTILNPVQPECMDPFEVKKTFGDRITLWGTLGTQTVFPFGTPQEVDRTVRDYIRELGPGGGYVIGPTHALKRDVPWENVVAFYEAVWRYGAYNQAV